MHLVLDGHMVRGMGGRSGHEGSSGCSRWLYDGRS